MMTETTATLDLLETIRGHQAAGTGVETPTTPTPVVVATTEDIRAGSVLIKSDVRLPQSVRFESKQYGHWKVLTGWTDSLSSGLVKSGVAFHAPGTALSVTFCPAAREATFEGVQKNPNCC